MVHKRIHTLLTHLLAIGVVLVLSGCFSSANGRLHFVGDAIDLYAFYDSDEDIVFFRSDDSVIVLSRHRPTEVLQWETSTDTVRRLGVDVVAPQGLISNHYLVYLVESSTYLAVNRVDFTTFDVLLPRNAHIPTPVGTSAELVAVANDHIRSNDFDRKRFEAISGAAPLRRVIERLSQLTNLRAWALPE